MLQSGLALRALIAAAAVTIVVGISTPIVLAALSPDAERQPAAFGDDLSGPPPEPDETEVRLTDAAADSTPRAAGPAAATDAPAGGRKLYRVYRVTAYCDQGTTASGVPSGVGQCAAPRDIPFGSRVHIPALRRTFVVTDRTHRRFRHNTVDIFLPSEGDCLTFGRKYLECEITLPPAAPTVSDPNRDRPGAGARRPG